MSDKDDDLGFFSISDMVKKNAQQHFEKVFKWMDETKKYSVDSSFVFEDGNWVFKTTAVEMPPKHVPDTSKTIERKLKLVDENCLYKPVICDDGRGDEEYIYMGEVPCKENPNRVSLYFGINDSIYHASNWMLKRIKSHDYGDGDNYER